MHRQQQPDRQDTTAIAATFDGGGGKPEAPKKCASKRRIRGHCFTTAGPLDSKFNHWQSSAETFPVYLDKPNGRGRQPGQVYKLKY